MNHFPDVGGAMVKDIEIDSPAFCDPGTSDRSNGTRICSREDVLRAIALRPLAFEPWTRPLYSNTGFNLLGWATAHAAMNSWPLVGQGSGSDMDKMSPPVEELLHIDVLNLWE